MIGLSGGGRWIRTFGCLVGRCGFQAGAADVRPRLTTAGRVRISGANVRRGPQMGARGRRRRCQRRCQSTEGVLAWPVSPSFD
jgi:hypothetical protein